MTTENPNEGEMVATEQREDPHTCQKCGIVFDMAVEGYYVDGVDVGPDAEGGIAEVFRQDTEEQMGNKWTGFTEEDIGAWCDSCSWIVQRKREEVC